MGLASRQRQAALYRALQGRIFGWLMCAYTSEEVAYKLNIPVKIVRLRGFSTWDEFRGWQWTKIGRWLDTPEAKTARDKMELDFAAGTPLTYPTL